MIEEYIFYLNVEKNFSINTIKSYENVIGIYQEFLEIHTLDLCNINASEIKFYINELYSLKYSKTTISLHISVLKGLYNFIERKYQIQNPTLSLVYPKLDKNLPKFLFFSEMELLLNELEEGELRVYLIFIFIYATGTRLSEVSEIKLSDIYDGFVTVVGKGNKERKIPISSYVTSLIDKYVCEREYDSNYLFINKKGAKLSQRGISYLINKELDKFSIQQKVTPHMLRHTFASHLLTNGMDIKIVQELLGHSSLQTTQLYTHVTKTELIDTYNMVSGRNEDE